MDAKGFADHLALLIQRERLSQKQLADKSTVNKMTINRILKQRLTVVSGRTVTRLADALSLNPGSPDRARLFALAGWEETKDDRAGKNGVNPEIYLCRIQDDGDHQRIPPPADDGKPLPRTVRALRTPSQVVEVLLRLIQAAARVGPRGSGEIVISYHGPTDLFSVVEWERDSYNQALLAALKAGWDVVQVDRARRPPEHYLDWISKMPEMLEASGRFRPMRFREPGVLTPPYDVVVVAGIGSLLLLSARDERYVDSGYFLPSHQNNDSEFMEIVTQHSHRLQDQADELLRIHDYMSEDFIMALGDAQEHEGNCFVAMDGLRGFGDETLEIYKQRASLVQARGGPDALLAERLVHHNQQQWAGFQRYIDRYCFLDICPESAMARVSLDDWLTIKGAGTWTTEQLITRLRNTLALLERHYPQYQIGLVDDGFLPYIRRTYWMVKEGQAAFFESWRPAAGKRSEVDMQVLDPAAVTALGSHFMTQWKNPRVRKDLPYVRSRLTGQIRALEDKLAVS